MESKIKILSEQTINQIAAGEVIENPASVVKELIENSLDAGAKKIVVEVVAGGFGLIRISDNGSGMSKDDAILSLERHATSKIRKVEDLFSIRSMGFRGEALASIASISKFTMMTSLEANDGEGVKIVCEGGKFLSVETCARQTGTTIEVRSLFYTTPARKKFQKSPGQSLSEIHRIFTLLSLSRPDVEFLFLSQDKTFLHVTNEKIEGRILEVLGNELKKDLMTISYQEPWIKIEGMIGHPSADRSNRLGQYLFINQRAVTSNEIVYGVLNGYGTMLTMRRHPLFVLYVTLSGHLLDVNVHPQKREVRFNDQMLIKDTIAKAIRLTLQKPSSLISQHFEERLDEKPRSLEEIFACKEKSQNVKEFSGYRLAQSMMPMIQQSQDMLSFNESVAPKIDEMKFIGIYKHYILIEASSTKRVFKLPYIPELPEGILMIDLNAISSRLYFDQVKKNYKERQKLETTMQTLLFPIKMTFSSGEALLIEENRELIRSLGITLRAFGTNTFVIEGYSSFLDEEDLQDLVEGLLEDFKCKGSSFSDREELASMRAAKMISSRKAFYDLDKAKILLTQLLKIDHSYFCPFGKKIIGYLDKQSYEKLF